MLEQLLHGGEKERERGRERERERGVYLLSIALVTKPLTS
jgi:hypothetical protein